MTFWTSSNRDGYRCPRHSSGPWSWDSGTFPCRKSLSVSPGSSCASRKSSGSEEEPGFVASTDVLAHFHRYREKPKLTPRFRRPFLQLYRLAKIRQNTIFLRDNYCNQLWCEMSETWKTSIRKRNVSVKYTISAISKKAIILYIKYANVYKSKSRF